MIARLAAIAVVAAAPGAAAETDPPRRFEVGALVGATLVDDENALGNAPTRDGIVGGGAIVGLRGGYRFSGAVSGELEATYSQPDLAGGDGSARIVGYRAHALVHLSTGSIRPLALLGVGGSYLTTGSALAETDADPELYWGIGARLRARERIDVRVDLRHRIGPGRVDATSDMFEGSVSASWLL